MGPRTVKRQRAGKFVLQAGKKRRGFAKLRGFVAPSR